MKVADLDQHLTDLRQMLERAGVKGPVLVDLAAISDGLRPFRDHGLSDFAKFLIRAEAFSRGEVLVIPPKKPAAPKKESVPKPDAVQLAQEAKRLYDHASEPTVTVEMVDEMVGRVTKLDKPGMVRVALAMDLKFSGSGPAKPKIAEQIKKRILDRKGSFQRAGLIDRESPPTVQAE